MIFPIEIKEIIECSTPRELGYIEHFLHSFNSKIGSTNKYIEDLSWIEDSSIQEIESIGGTRRKSFERLFLKCYEVLAFGFNVTNPDSFRRYEKGKILIYKYLLFSQVALAKEKRSHYQYFQKRALRLAVKWGQFDLVSNILRQLHKDSKYHGEVKKAHYYKRRLDQNSELERGYGTIVELLSRANLPDFSGIKKESEKVEILRMYNSPVGHVRLRRVVLYGVIMLYSKEIHKSLDHLKYSSEAIIELINIIKSNPEYFNERELPMALNNNHILSAYKGALDQSFTGFQEDISKLLKYRAVYRLYRMNVMVVSFYHGESPIFLNDEDCNYKSEEKLILAASTLVVGETSLSELNRIQIERNEEEIDFFVRVYQILCFIGKDDLDQADRLIFSLRKSLLLTKPFYEEFHSIILQLLWEWSNKGFLGEIDDLSPDLFQALKEHYETTWNPFSPDLIPLHLWRKKEGIPNYRDAYAHLFACKRERARKQGILFN
ncbi:hypothetical protein HZ996_09695 [Cryomorphaceae bacterium]|nr:hypothetical protein HZ996_09695 [Cryomorphaceae bacterium]